MSFNRFFKSGSSQDEKPPTAEKVEKKASAESANPAEENAAPSGLPHPPEDSDRSYYEKDNCALRIQRLVDALDFWNDYEKERAGIPYLRFAFGTRFQATEALESLSCVHRAKDTGHLVCTEPVTLGCYRTADGSYEVFLAGEQLSPRVWSEAVEKFPAFHGRYRSQHKPDSSPKKTGPQPASRSVTLKKEYYQLDVDRTRYFRIFEAAAKESARAFLRRRENNINHPDHTIVVETPDGTFYRDINGIHAEADDKNEA